MTRKERMTAIRFLLAIPPGVWMHIMSLPDYVFMYIYEVGHIQDLPWIRFEEADTGQLIRRKRTTQVGLEVGRMCKVSPLFRELGFNDEIQLVFHEEIGLDLFENKLLAFCQRHSFKHQSIF